MIEIRRCQPHEIKLVMGFIENHWKKGHILATHQPLMDWQHQADDGSYNYLLAFNDSDLIGVLGYIPTSHFDVGLKNENVLWLALWKIIEGSQSSGLGLRMIATVGRMDPAATIAVSGINKATHAIYKALGYKVGELRQYFLVNPGLPQRLIANPDNQELPKPKGGGVEFKEMKTNQLAALASDFLPQANIPRKTPTYFLHRFLRHPVYAYRVFLARGKECKPSFFATRVAEHQGARALRIVDFAGDTSSIGHCGDALAKLMNEEQAEYADFWQAGIPEQHLSASGFSAVDPDGRVVVPNFYEPFEASNGRIFYAVRAKSTPDIIICRADGDQDRPNQLSAQN